MDQYLLAIAQKNHCHITENKTRSTISFIMECDNEFYINIDSSKITSESEKRICLAHELGHCISGTTYTIYHSPYYRGSAEYLADYKACQLLMPIDQFLAVIHQGVVEKWDLAEHFNVPETFVKRAIEIYTYKGLLQHLQSFGED